MPSVRASIFEADDLDVSEFQPKSGPDTSAPLPEEVRVVAAAANFHSREATPPLTTTTRREQRRHRTGRNVQFNVKASQETVDVFYAISDSQGWVLGETLEHALQALQRIIKQGNGAGSI